MKNPKTTIATIAVMITVVAVAVKVDKANNTPKPNEPTRRETKHHKSAPDWNNETVPAGKRLWIERMMKTKP